VISSFIAHNLDSKKSMLNLYSTPAPMGRQYLPMGLLHILHQPAELVAMCTKPLTIRRSVLHNAVPFVFIQSTILGFHG